MKIQSLSYASFEQKASKEVLEIARKLRPNKNSGAKGTVMSMNDKETLTLSFDSVKVLTVAGKSSYIFAFDPPTRYSPSFHNYTIAETDDGIKQTVTTYTPTKKWINEWRSGKKKKFEGDITFYVVDIEPIRPGNSLGVANGGRVSTVADNKLGIVITQCSTTDVYITEETPCNPADGHPVPGCNPPPTLACNHAYYCPPTVTVYTRPVTVCIESDLTLSQGGYDTPPGGGINTHPYVPSKYEPCGEVTNGGNGTPCDEITGGPIGYDPALAMRVNYIKNAYFLDTPHADWLYDHTYLMDELEDYAAEYYLENPETLGARIFIDLERNGATYGPFNSAFYNTLAIYEPAVAMDPNIQFAARMYYSQQVALLKHAHSDWDDWKIKLHATIALAQAFLDGIGLLPVVGETADIINGTIYLVQGDGFNATLSYGSAIPVLGWFSMGAKWAFKRVATPAGKLLDLEFKVINNIVDFGSRSNLRKVLGLNPGNPAQAHHIIPWQFTNHGLVQKAAKKDFHMNEPLNGIPLPKSVHVEGMVHSAYNAKIAAELAAISNRVGPNVSPADAADEIEALIAKIRTWINNNPGENLNNITF